MKLLPGSTARETLIVSACCAAVAAGALAISLPQARAGCCLSPDAVGYLATANNWISGAGFVDPILYSHYLPDTRPPVPAFAIRPPAVSVLFAPLLALGADVGDMLVWHTVWAAIVGVIAVLCARPWMSLPAAMGFAIAITWSPAWKFVSSRLLTEVTAVAVLLLGFASIRAGMASVRGSLLLALLTLLGWLVRPNLGLMLPAIVLAEICELGPRAAVRHRPLWVYVGTFAVLLGAIVLTMRAATGLNPYAHYGVMMEIIHVTEVRLYQKEYVGWLEFVLGNSEAVLGSIGENIRTSYRLLFWDGVYLGVGWLAAPALAVALFRPGAGSLENRFSAFAAFGFIAVALATYGGFDPVRYLLLGVVASWFAVMAAADRAISWLKTRLRGEREGARRVIAGLRWVPALLMCVLALLQGPNEPLLGGWRGWQIERLEQQWALCRQMNRDAVVASFNPWRVYFWCGNAGLALPSDLDDLDWLHRYLDEMKPGYVLVLPRSGWGLLADSSRLSPVATRGQLVLYEVIDAGPESRPWRAPLPVGVRADAFGER